MILTVQLTQMLPVNIDSKRLFSTISTCNEDLETAVCVLPFLFSSSVTIQKLISN